MKDKKVVDNEKKKNNAFIVLFLYMLIAIFLSSLIF